MVWDKLLLGEVLTERQETPVEADLDSGAIQIVSKISFGRGEIELRLDGKTKTDLILIRPGDLVLSGINATKGAIAVYGEHNQKPIAATIHYSAYIPEKNQVNPYFLWWFLRSDAFREIVQEYVPGGIKSELRPKKFLSIPIHLPPIATQERILKFVDEVSTKILHAKHLHTESVEKSKVLMESLIQETFSKLPMTGKLADLLVMKPRSGPSFLTDANWEGTRVLMPSAVSGFGVNINKVEFGMGNETISEKDLLEPGDVLIARGNKREQVGNAGVVPPEAKGWVCANLLMRMKVDTDKLDQHFLIYWLRSPFMRRYVKDRMIGTNPNIQKINQQVILNYPFPTNATIDEQRRIVACLDGLQAKVNALRELQVKGGEELSALMPSILDKAFKEEL